MLTAYINYPNPHFTLHSNPTCSEVRKRQKSGQRTVRIDRSTISIELSRFAQRHYPFAAQAEINDMWLEVDFDDAEFETAVVRHIRRLLGTYYRPLAQAPIDAHKCT